MECRLAGETVALGENLPSATLSTINPTQIIPTELFRGASQSFHEIGLTVL
jgi:hypothetical protein